MMKRKFLVILTVLATAAVCDRAEAQDKSAPPSQPAAPAAPASMPSSLVIEQGGSGPYKAEAVGDATLPGFAIYRPQDLSAFGNGKKLPVVLWGNGAGANNSAGYKNFLNEIASQGFIVIAIGPYDLLVSKNQALERKPTRAAQFLEALDWITAQNKLDGGIYNGKIEVAKVAVMGHSLGGLQAIEISTDPRVTATALCNSGIIKGAPPSGMPIMPGVKKELLDQLHAPIIYIMGGRSDMAWDNGADDYARISKVPAVMASQEVGHGGTYGAPHGGSFGVAAVAWLKWQLNGDKEAATMFTGGDQCGLSKGDPKWKVEVKNLSNP